MKTAPDTILFKPLFVQRLGRGLNYRFYAMAGAGLLHYSNMAVSELILYFYQPVYSHVARGTTYDLTRDEIAIVEGHCK